MRKLTEQELRESRSTVDLTFYYDGNSIRVTDDNKNKIFIDEVDWHEDTISDFNLTSIDVDNILNTQRILTFVEDAMDVDVWNYYLNKN